MKKFLSIFMVLTIILSLPVTAFAADSNELPQQLSGLEWDYLTLGDDYYIDENGDIIYTYEQEEEIDCSYVY